MSYQVIARKWRPQTFEEVTGQEAITQTLRNALEYDRLHHAYLFSGARGVGKTTTARLFAKALNCHKTDRPNLLPCSASDPDACSSCLEISESRSMDVLEIDAASHTGIDDVRETILDSININPARDRYKVFIIDEVHQLSRQAFNALLKTLEEPPPKVVFIMATTELHKVPDTILSRCQEFQFRTIPLQKIFDRLKMIAEAEKIDISDDALREIARSGEGSMRDAQSNFDQVISFSGASIAVDNVVDALGFASLDMITRVVRSIAASDSGDVLKVVDELVTRGQDLRNFCRDMLSLFRDLLVFKVADGSERLFESSVLSRHELKGLAEPFSESDLLRFFNSLSETETRLKEATQSRYTVEVGLIKLVEMGRVARIEDILDRLARLENGSAGESKAQAAGTVSSGKPEAEEKKTLISDKYAEEPPKSANTDADRPRTPTISHTSSAALPTSQLVQTEPRTKIDTSFVETIPVKLPPILAEELEHVDDKWLDEAFELRLLENGDNLSPIPGAEELVRILIGTAAGFVPEKVEIKNGGAAAATAPAIDISAYMPDFSEDPADAIPELPPDPTDEDLMIYAQNHPAVKRALRIFRAKIIDVKRTDD